MEKGRFHVFVYVNNVGEGRKVRAEKDRKGTYACSECVCFAKIGLESRRWIIPSIATMRFFVVKGLEGQQDGADEGMVANVQTNGRLVHEQTPRLNM